MSTATQPVDTRDPFAFPEESAASRAASDDSFASSNHDISRLMDDLLARGRAQRKARTILDAEDAENASAEKLELAGAVAGGDFIHGNEAELEPIWGTPERCAWAAGEAMMLFGPQGTGKTTVAQQLMKGRLGLLDEVLGMPVATTKSRVLYVAGDRPRQAARAMRRLFPSAADNSVLDERLVVWKGPLPGDLTRRPSLLRELAQHYGCDTIFVDSIKDVVSKLNDDEAGSMYNRAIQLCMVAGIQVCDLHHPRKADSKNGNRPKSVDDVYGSTWLTAGHGSIISLWGKTGDLVVELSQLKMVNDEIGPFKIEHDHDRGMSHIYERFDLVGALIAEGALTAVDAAGRMFDTDAPTADQKAKARRALRALVRDEQAVEQPGVAGGAGGGQAARWVPTAKARSAGGRTGRPEADGPAAPQWAGRRGYNPAF